MLKETHIFLRKSWPSSINDINSPCVYITISKLKIRILTHSNGIITMQLHLVKDKVMSSWVEINNFLHNCGPSVYLGFMVGHRCLLLTITQ